MTLRGWSRSVYIMSAIIILLHPLNLDKSNSMDNRRHSMTSHLWRSVSNHVYTVLGPPIHITHKINATVIKSRLRSPLGHTSYPYHDRNNSTTRAILRTIRPIFDPPWSSCEPGWSPRIPNRSHFNRDFSPWLIDILWACARFLSFIPPPIPHCLHRWMRRVSRRFSAEKEVRIAE